MPTRPLKHDRQSAWCCSSRDAEGSRRASPFESAALLRDGYASTCQCVEEVGASGNSKHQTGCTSHVSLILEKALGQAMFATLKKEEQRACVSMASQCP